MSLNLMGRIAGVLLAIMLIGQLLEQEDTRSTSQTADFSQAHRTASTLLDATAVEMTYASYVIISGDQASQEIRTKFDSAFENRTVVHQATLSTLENAAGTTRPSMPFAFELARGELIDVGQQISLQIDEANTASEQNRQAIHTTLLRQYEEYTRLLNELLDLMEAQMHNSATASAVLDLERMFATLRLRLAKQAAYLSAPLANSTVIYYTTSLQSTLQTAQTQSDWRRATAYFEILGINTLQNSSVAAFETLLDEFDFTVMDILDYSTMAYEDRLEVVDYEFSAEDFLAAVADIQASLAAVKTEFDTVAATPRDPEASAQHPTLHLTVLALAATLGLVALISLFAKPGHMKAPKTRPDRGNDARLSEISRLSARINELSRRQ